MSLIRLLSMGRSFNGQKGQLSRYKVSELNLVPKFASTRSVGPNGTQRLPWVTAEMLAANAPESVSSGPANQPTPAAKKSGWRDRVVVITVKLIGSNPFSSERAAQNTRRMVQSELLLQNIKVVRNDLHDADLEIRPLPTLQSQSGGIAAAVERGGAGAWQKVVRRAGEFARSVVFLH